MWALSQVGPPEIPISGEKHLLPMIYLDTLAFAPGAFVARCDGFESGDGPLRKGPRVCRTLASWPPDRRSDRQLFSYVWQKNMINDAELVSWFRNTHVIYTYAYVVSLVLPFLCVNRRLGRKNRKGATTKGHICIVAAKDENLSFSLAWNYATSSINVGSV